MFCVSMNAVYFTKNKSILERKFIGGKVHATKEFAGVDDDGENTYDYTYTLIGNVSNYERQKFEIIYWFLLLGPLVFNFIAVMIYRREMKKQKVKINI